MWELIDTVNEPILLAGIAACTWELCRRLAANARHREEHRP